MAEDDQATFATMRPLLQEQIKDLKEAVVTLNKQTVEHEKQIALINQRLVMYSTGIGVAVGAVINVSIRMLS